MLYISLKDKLKSVSNLRSGMIGICFLSSFGEELLDLEISLVFLGLFFSVLFSIDLDFFKLLTKFYN